MEFAGIGCSVNIPSLISDLPSRAQTCLAGLAPSSLSALVNVRSASHHQVALLPSIRVSLVRVTLFHQELMKRWVGFFLKKKKILHTNKPYQMSNKYFRFSGGDYFIMSAKTVMITTRKKMLQSCCNLLLRSVWAHTAI